MPYRLSVSVSGGAVDYDAFQTDRGADLGGTLGTYKRLQKAGRLIELAGKYWKSRVVEFEYLHDFDAAFIDLLTQLKPTLLELKSDPEVQIWVQQVQDIFYYRDAAGGGLNPAQIAMLAEVGAGFDCDISRRIGRRKSRLV
jgi:hypothetical protein